MNRRTAARWSARKRAAIYRRAARRVEHQWTQKFYKNPWNGGECMVQAVLSAAGIKDATMPQRMVRELTLYFSRLPDYKDGYSLQKSLENWNDVEDRTPAEVALHLCAVADEIDPPRKGNFLTVDMVLQQPMAADLAASTPSERELVTV